MATSLGSFHRKGGVDVPVADGGTGQSSASAGLAALNHGTQNHLGILGVGKVVQQLRIKNGNAIFPLTGNIPRDGTTPLNTEGNQILTLAITPKSVSNVLVFDFSSFGIGTTNASIAALFRDSISAAIAAMATATDPFSMRLQWYMNAPSTSAQTYKIRVGSESGGIEIGGRGSSAPAFGAGVHATVFTITEYAPN